MILLQLIRPRRLKLIVPASAVCLQMSLGVAAGSLNIGSSIEENHRRRLRQEHELSCRTESRSLRYCMS